SGEKSAQPTDEVATNLQAASPSSDGTMSSSGLSSATVLAFCGFKNSTFSFAGSPTAIGYWSSGQRQLASRPIPSRQTRKRDWPAPSPVAQAVVSRHFPS